MVIHRHPPAVERHALTSTRGGTQSLAFDRRPSRVIRPASRESVVIGQRAAQLNAASARPNAANATNATNA